jgi:hypothetical protein
MFGRCWIVFSRTGFTTQKRSIFIPASCGHPKDQPQDMGRQEVMKPLLNNLAVELARRFGLFWNPKKRLRFIFGLRTF